mgnify:CR=1 FL=1
MTVKFRSNGMQWCTSYATGERIAPMCKKIGYWIPEDRIEKENLQVLHDSSELLVLYSPQGVIHQFENN